MSSIPSSYPIKISASVEILDYAAAKDVAKVYRNPFMILNQANSLNRGKINANVCSW
ncbi:unnamed protein product [Hymenolepis diminuta]|uniref:Uncharacterized protein n=1 Tax=Hymenolepis diminuta TaxID=6216 RepID=A0A564Y132_HYMDI|nr:unnamed protein product [Hymenolepis diminuta]